MLLLGIDIGTSSIKVAIVDAQTQQTVVTAQYPETETPITSLQNGWAEQSPEMWWEHVQMAILKANATGTYNPKDIAAIGIAYQMHGLVCVDKNQHVLRDSIIWCDSRAVPYGDAAFTAIGEEKCLSHLLNSPGNFTASKLAWVKDNEPHIYEQIDKIMLPGDFIAMKLSGCVTTSASALSEGVFWDFKNKELSKDVMGYYGFHTSIIPTIKDVFTEHGLVSESIAAKLSLTTGIPITYKAGDQPNNALSLNVLQPGEVAATAGTSGVIYGVGDTLSYDKQSRINSFAHVNHTAEQTRIGTLLCINGTGIANSFTRKLLAADKSYPYINEAAKQIPIGSEGLTVLPFGNGAERIFNNRTVGAHYQNINFNIHTEAHIFRAVQEGIAFSFRYGLDIMKENGITPSVIRAGKANLFLSDVFISAFVNATNVPVELYQVDGSVGAAKGAGIGAKIFASEKEAFANAKPLDLIEPTVASAYNDVYEEWKGFLMKQV
ncbi:xylulokinase [Parasediminibacterium sp. JCM 36343]|uniref:xylulokinase n=1 Tax=Parasediminibacterium sp. JCM 36343 TaxID=3374279 RepID=UPI00397E7B5F